MVRLFRKSLHIGLIFILLMTLPVKANGNNAYVGTARANFNSAIMKQTIMGGGFVSPQWQQSNTGNLNIDNLYGEPGKPKAKLGAAAYLIDDGSNQIALVSVDILALKKVDLDIITNRIENELSIPASNVLINATHSHNVSNVIELHGVSPQGEFLDDLKDTVFNAVALAKLEMDNNKENNHRTELHFKTISITSTPLEGGAPYLPKLENEVPDTTISILAFKHLHGPQSGQIDALFSYPTHHLGTYAGPNTLGPGPFGLVAQELEYDRSGVEFSSIPPITFSYFSGTNAGSYFNSISDGDSTINKIAIEAFKSKINSALNNLGTSSLISNPVIALSKRPFDYQIRDLDPGIPTGKGRIEQIHKQLYEDNALGDNRFRDYLHSRSDEYLGCGIDNIISQEGDIKTSWIQNFQIGNMNLIGLPGELFPQYGMEIKKQLGHRTIVLGLTNDHIGYIPYDESKYLYQSVVADHSFADYNTGNLMIKELGLIPLGANSSAVDGNPLIEEGTFGSGTKSLQSIGSPFNWSTSWNEIIPLDYNGDGNTDLLFWDKNTGWAHLLKSDDDDSFELVREFIGWDIAWDKIIPLDYNGDENTDLLYWDKHTGWAHLYKSKGDTAFELVREFIGWDTAWDKIIPLDYNGDGNTDLLYWDKHTGWAHLYKSNGDAAFEFVRNFTGWSTEWSEIIPLDYNGDGDTDLLYWNSDSGKISTMKSLGDGNFEYGKISATWPIQFDAITLWSYNDDSKDELFVYEKSTGWGWVLESKSAFNCPPNNHGCNGSFTLVSEEKPEQSEWDKVIKLKAGEDTNFLFWDKDLGRAKIVRYIDSPSQ